MDRRQTTHSARMHTREYNYDNLARRQAIPSAEKRGLELAPSTNKRTKKFKKYHIGQMLYLTVAVVATVVVSVMYLQLRFEINAIEMEVSSLEKELNTIFSDNNELENRINSSIDYAQIEDIAINELGMKYASEDQIILCNDMDGDYVHQIKSIDEAAIIE